MLFFTIVFATLVACAEIDICVASFPEIRQDFNLSPFMVELVLGANLIAHCLTALIVGNLGDKYGNKKIINLGFVIFIFGSLIATFASNYYLLILGRILQGAGVAAPMVLAAIIITDYYPPSKQRKAMTMLNGIVTTAICLAPVIGSYISLCFGWRGNFGLLFILGIMALIMVQLFIPNDSRTNHHIKISLSEYLIVLKSKTTMLYILSLCLAVGAYYSFVGIAPLFYRESLGVSIRHFGFFLGAMTFTFGTLSMFYESLIKYFGKKNCFIASLILITIFLVGNCLIIIFNITNPFYITLIMLSWSAGFVIPNNIIFLLALGSIPGAKGRISAVMANIKWAITTIGLQTASYFYQGNFAPIGLVIGFMTIVAITLSYQLWKSEAKMRESFI